MEVLIVSLLDTIFQHICFRARRYGDACGDFDAADLVLLSVSASKRPIRLVLRASAGGGKQTADRRRLATSKT